MKVMKEEDGKVRCHRCEENGRCLREHQVTKGDVWV
jgi:hypothetical protein